MRALLSVYEKDGIVDFGRGLVDLGYEIIASGGTSRELAAHGVAHMSVEDVTGFAEMLDGRVKTLHPKVHAGILADRSKPQHLLDIESLGIETIDIVACNLYPFAGSPSIETIDVGGPSMIRAAGKNHTFVSVLVDSNDYEPVLKALAEGGSVDYETRRALAAKAFDHLSRYDRLISLWLGGKQEDALALDDEIAPVLMKKSSLRYGENPHQDGALYTRVGRPSWFESMVRHSGMELSYLNLFDADAAWRLVHELGDSPSAAIIKHANPCGVATSTVDISQAYSRAFECDPISAFGGIIALNRPVDMHLAQEMASNPKADVVIAPSYEDGVIEFLSKKRKNTRFLTGEPPEVPALQFRSIGDAILVQAPDTFVTTKEQWKVVTTAQPDPSRWEEIEMAWKVCAKTSSNAIVIVSEGAAIGIGAGQQNRLDSSRIAIAKAKEKVVGSVAASDAFFPFPDGMLTLAEAGVSIIISPGGSINDASVIEAANDAGVVLIFTGERHFRH
ncbi:MULTISPECIES: bifunctional phosphoribosylaminoimidazolecarboxamide formyltransferase/IMP cyclohydrolase [Acidithrix]|uniref:Bifunctional purine biosynthesis protein PurH n=1 Tax=Acidithrix ferrooxidans TaxID=1280514 RepID=A0A0D8HGP1_9ACTN|nr:MULTISPECIES: bifunctional phosphoribosylaminoimidazolecarboxamide formyltransferase/IMP cyclohydrolase [Acidithrix]KJF16246.1 bifunctional purine biosynthesis protein PurH [Acidithrix ferrooxidans]CAG4932417.1 unnamed protein product [Acidithrix sp. C25]